MDVELLVVADCPSERPALDLVRTALAALDVSASVTTTLVTDDRDAQARGFTGSPTFLIDGRDPFAQPGASAGMACRLYRTPTGLAGLPSPDDLREAIRRAATS